MVVVRFWGEAVVGPSEVGAKVERIAKDIPYKTAEDIAESSPARRLSIATRTICEVAGASHDLGLGDRFDTKLPTTHIRFIITSR